MSEFNFGFDEMYNEDKALALGTGYEKYNYVKVLEKNSVEVADEKGKDGEFFLKKADGEEKSLGKILGFFPLFCKIGYMVSSKDNKFIKISEQTINAGIARGDIVQNKEGMGFVFKDPALSKIEVNKEFALHIYIPSEKVYAVLHAQKTKSWGIEKFIYYWNETRGEKGTLSFYGLKNRRVSHKGYTFNVFHDDDKKVLAKHQPQHELKGNDALAIVNGVGESGFNKVVEYITPPQGVIGYSTSNLITAGDGGDNSYDSSKNEVNEVSENIEEDMNIDFT